MQQRGEGLLTHLSVVIPALNEASRLPATLVAIDAYVGSTTRWQPAELVVVDDGSSDGTRAAVGRSRTALATPLTLVSHQTNRGKGAAIRSGVLASNGDWVLLCDADLATPIEELERLAAEATERRIAIGSRAVDRRLIEVRQPSYRDLMGRTFNLAVRALATPGLRDTQCGFKLLPGATARALVAAMEIDGFAYDVELLLLARRWGLQVAEVGVRWRHVEASRVLPLRHSAEMLRDLLLLAARRLGGRLPPAPASSGGDAAERGDLR